jgi:Fuc2NAc and GlcNAc transferase
MEPWLPAIIAAAMTAGAVTRLTEIIARRRSLLDVPNERSSHVTPTPRIGGLGIAAGAIVGWLVAGGPGEPMAAVVVVAGAGIAAVGLADDLWSTSVLGKYLAQLATSAVVAIAISPSLLLAIGSVGFTIEGPVAIVLATLGLTALVNAVNFMDGIDGIVGAVSIAVALVAVALVGAPGWPLAVSLAAACAGFLVWNWAPASIFMGDVGSHFLGLMLGAVLLMGPGGAVDVMPALIVVSPLLFDTGFTLLRRARARQDVFAGHREHLYQRLVQAGATHRTVAAGYAGATLLAGALAIAWPALPGPAQLAGLAGLLVVGIGYAVLVTRQQGLVTPARP